MYEFSQEYLNDSKLSKAHPLCKETISVVTLSHLFATIPQQSSLTSLNLNFPVYKME